MCGGRGGAEQPHGDAGSVGVGLVIYYIALSSFCHRSVIVHTSFNHRYTIVILLSFCQHTATSPHSTHPPTVCYAAKCTDVQRCREEVREEDGLLECVIISMFVASFGIHAVPVSLTA